MGAKEGRESAFFLFKTKTMSAISNRIFQIVIVEPGTKGYVFTKEHITFDQLFHNKDKNPFEFIFALQEIADAVLDLKENESMYFQPNRDNNQTKGILLRIK